MILGVVSDTHNRIQNVEKIIGIFNSYKVDFVIHTGDITQAKTLEKFSLLRCPFVAVYGNNDLKEPDLEDVAKKNNFELEMPPLIKEIGNKTIAIMHEPDGLEEFLEKNKNVDVILHGHTHTYRNEEKNGVTIFNPGECSGILEGKNAVGIIRLEDLEIKRIFF